MEIIALLVIVGLGWFYADSMVKRVYVTIEDRLEILTWALVFFISIFALSSFYSIGKDIYQKLNDKPKEQVVLTPSGGKYGIQCTATEIENTKE